MANLAVLEGFLPLWLNAQRPMSEVVRWENFPAYGQRLVEHANSLPLVGRLVMSVASRPLDAQLFMDCLILHDHGEPPSGGDEHAGNKTVGKERREWEAFQKLLEKFPASLKVDFLQAFSLQYVRKPKLIDLPNHGLEIVKRLRQTRAYEAGLFEFTERFDYVLSAYVGHQRGVRNPKETMIAHTIGNQSGKLDALAEEFPELGALWSIQLRSELQALCND